MYYTARFEEWDGQLFRFDTRIYLTNVATPDADGPCIAAIVGKNPGSALPTSLNVPTNINLNGDKFLPTVRNRFIAAYKAIAAQPPRNAYIQVWNLMYLCDPDLRCAVSRFSKLTTPRFCRTEANTPKIVWFAWGPPTPGLDLLKARFLTREFQQPFYFDMLTMQVVPRVPTATAAVKHTQGLPASPIVNHLSSILSVV